MLKKTLESIGKNNSYVIQVKNSKMNLTKEIKSVVSTTKAKATYTTKEKNRNRKEVRVIKVFKPTGEEHKKYYQIRNMISVERTREIQGRKSKSIHYYVTNIETPDAKRLLEIIRKHWWVENKLHYVKDVIQKEDYIKYRTFDRHKKISMFRNIIFNFLKMNNHKSIKKGLEECANNLKLCLKLVRT